MYVHNSRACNINVNFMTENMTGSVSICIEWSKKNGKFKKYKYIEIRKNAANAGFVAVGIVKEGI